MAKGDFIPRHYRRGLRPSIPGGEGVYLEEELRRIEETLQDILKAVPQVAYTPPQDPVEGMIRYAKTPWNPLNIGDAWVTYKNGAWVAL
jgi:hypothetical protein